MNLSTESISIIKKIQPAIENIVKTEKDNWNREEIKLILLKFAKDCDQDEELLCHYDGDYRDLNKWIKENLYTMTPDQLNNKEWYNFPKEKKIIEKQLNHITELKLFLKLLAKNWLIESYEDSGIEIFETLYVRWLKWYRVEFVKDKWEEIYETF